MFKDGCRRETGGSVPAPFEERMAIIGQIALIWGDYGVIAICVVVVVGMAGWAHCTWPAIVWQPANSTTRS